MCINNITNWFKVYLTCCGVGYAGQTKYKEPGSHATSLTELKIKVNQFYSKCFVWGGGGGYNLK